MSHLSRIIFSLYIYSFAGNIAKWDYLSYFPTSCSLFLFLPSNDLIISISGSPGGVRNARKWALHGCIICLLLLRWFSTLSWHSSMLWCWRGDACDKTWDLLFTWRGERSFSSTNNEEGLPSPCLTFRSQMKETTAATTTGKESIG